MAEPTGLSPIEAAVRDERRRIRAAMRRWNRAALRALAELRHPRDARAKRAFLRRYADTWAGWGPELTRDGRQVLALTEPETELVRVVLGVADLADKDRYDRPGPVTPQIHRLVVRARTCLRRQQWDDARRAWEKADGLDRLQHDHLQETELAELRPLAAEGARVRAGRAHRRRKQQEETACWRGRIAVEARAMRDRRPELSLRSLAKLLHSRFRTLAAAVDEQVPSPERIRHLLPADL